MTAVLIVLIAALLAWSLGLRALMRLGSLGAIALGLTVALDAGLAVGLPLIAASVVTRCLACSLNRSRRGGPQPISH